MFYYPKPANEPVKTYAPGTSERSEIKKALQNLSSTKTTISCEIGSEKIQTKDQRPLSMPHQHKQVLADISYAGEPELKKAAEAALNARSAWAEMPWNERAAIFLKAAELMAGPYRAQLNAATMLGQSKNVYQAEIDSACELIDFVRFNTFFYQEILKEQPQSAPGVWNRTEHRPLEGFVLAITPFNFTAIAGNLAITPALLGNTVIWKPSDTQLLAAHLTFQILKEAGLPPGVINMVAADGPLVSKTLVHHSHLAGIHFTGSTRTFRSIWQTVGANIDRYRTFPRLVGETGGKDFIFAHASADPEALVTALVRGAFEYQGQKCSAASRAYIPRSLWPKIKERVISEISGLKMGDVQDFSCFVNAVIDRKSFDKITSYLEHANHSSEAKILAGGKWNKEVGYFVQPTLIEATSPLYQSMVEEIFGPVLTVYLYDEAMLDETLDLCDRSTPYSLTGAIFAQDRSAIVSMSRKLRNAAGNFYINDKPTGAVVGQQPFGGSRASGTNDKAGSSLNLYRWISPQSIKETFVPAKNYPYSFMDPEK